MTSVAAVVLLVLLALILALLVLDGDPVSCTVEMSTRRQGLRDVVTEYERGYRDGLMHAAQLAENWYWTGRGNVRLHMEGLAEGLRTGALARDIEGRGDD